MLYINASNIRSLGGLRLLNEIIRLKIPDVFFLLPNFYKEISVKNSITFYNGLFSIISSSLFLFKNAKSNDTIIHLGNYPPIFYNKAYNVLFIQNRLLVDDDIKNSFKLALSLRKIYLKLFIKKKQKIFVQTESMKSLVLDKFPHTDVNVCPFISMKTSNFVNKKIKFDPKKSYFFYPASGENNKNHKNLAKAWSILASKGNFFRLFVTLDSYYFKKYYSSYLSLNPQIKITNLGVVKENTIRSYLINCEAIIYPSYCESFGIPLIEAEKSKTPIISAELDYVRDVCVPIETFDPNSPKSISNAVLRYLGMDKYPQTATVSSFISHFT